MGDEPAPQAFNGSGGSGVPSVVRANEDAVRNDATNEKNLASEFGLATQQLIDKLAIIQRTQGVSVAPEDAMVLQGQQEEMARIQRTMNDLVAQQGETVKEIAQDIR